MARCLVTVCHRSEFGAFGAAARFGDGTSRMAGATARGMDGRGDIPGEEDAIAFGGRVHRGDGGSQDLGVGMLRVAANGVGRTGFHHAPQVPDDDALAEVFDKGEVVRDEQVREPVVALDVLNFEVCPDPESNPDQRVRNRRNGVGKRSKKTEYRAKTKSGS